MTDYRSGHEQSDRQYAEAVERGVRLGRMILRVEEAIGRQLHDVRLTLARIIAATHRHEPSRSEAGHSGDVI